MKVAIVRETDGNWAGHPEDPWGLGLISYHVAWEDPDGRPVASYTQGTRMILRKAGLTDRISWATVFKPTDRTPRWVWVSGGGRTMPVNPGDTPGLEDAFLAAMATAYMQGRFQP